MERLSRFVRSSIAAVTQTYLGAIVLLVVAPYLLPPEYGDLTRSQTALLLFLALNLLIPVAGLGLLYAPLLMPRGVVPTDDEHEITVLSFNLQAATHDLASLINIID